MAPQSSVSTTVAELFAILGVDDTPLNEGLKRAEIRMADSAQKQIVSIKSVEDLFRKLPAAMAPVVDAYVKLGAAGVKINDDIKAGLQLLAEQKRVEASLASQQMANRKESIAIQQIQRNLDESRAAAQAAYRAADLRETRLIQDARKRLNDEIIKQQELEGRGQTLGETGGGNGFMFQHLLASVALYGAIDFGREALGRPLALQREAAQTGLGVQGVQQLQYAAAATGTPMEMATGSIARLQERVGSMQPKTKNALSLLGLDPEKFKSELENGPIQAITKLSQKIDGLANATQKQQAIFDLFGGRTGEVSLLISELAKGMQEGTINTDKQTEAVSRLSRELEKLKIEGQVKIDAFVGDVLDRRNAGGMGSYLQMAATLGGIALGVMAAPASVPLSIGAGVVGGLGAAYGTNYGLNKVGGLFSTGDNPALPQAPSLNAPAGIKPLELVKGEQAAIQKTLGDRYRWMEKERTQAEAAERKRQQEEARRAREIEEFYRDTMAALNELGGSSKQNAEKMRAAFETLNLAFGRGLISIQELTDATANYFAMMEDNLARPGLRDAIRMFEQGLIGPEELIKARKRALALDTRGAAEEAFIKGEIDPQGLRNAQGIYRQSLRNFAPGNAKDYFLGPGGSVISSPRELGLPPTSPQDFANRARQSGTINVIPMDEFSDRMLREWQRQGSLPR